jgi:hypothetical protein
MKKIKSLIVWLGKLAMLVFIPIIVSAVILIGLLYLAGLAVREAELLYYGPYENIPPEYQTIIEYIKASTKNVVIDMLLLAHLAAIFAAISAGSLTGIALAYWLNQKHYEKEIKENDKNPR